MKERRYKQIRKACKLSKVVADRVNRRLCAKMLEENYALQRAIERASFELVWNEWFGKEDENG